MNSAISGGLFKWWKVGSTWLGLAGLLLFVPMVSASVQKVGKSLYAYVSENDSSANATFLVFDDGILVVDTGLNAMEGRKLLAAIRKISPLPVRFIVNTHYHPDHRGGNSVVGPRATVISTAFTREHMPRSAPQSKAADAVPGRQIVTNSLTLYLGGHQVQVYHPGPAHTMGDLVVYFPDDEVIATGDLFLTNSCPAMDEGDLENWIAALDHILTLPLKHVVPGHFEVAGKDQLERFRDYLADLQTQVAKMYRSGFTLEKVKNELSLDRYKDFRQFPQYQATFGENAAAYYQQLKQRSR